MAQEGGVQGMSAKAGLEPARISTVDFESTAKTGKDFDISHYTKSSAKALTK
ncbi:TPA: hypothetical protein ACGB09_001961 [Citrobacter freundii]